MATNNCIIIPGDPVILPQQGQQGTTLSATVTATGHLINRFNWTIDKSVVPTTWNLFKGDSGVSEYTISVTKNGPVSEAYFDGQVCVDNGGDEDTQNLTIIIELRKPPSQTIIAAVPVNLGADFIIPAHQSRCYDYRIDIPTGSIVTGATYRITANVTITNHSGSLNIPFGPHPTASANLPSTATTVNNTITVEDTNGETFNFNSSGQQSYPITYTCDDDEGTHTNTATILETGQSDSASVTVNCYELEVTKDASTSLTRTYDWTIAKFADQSETTLSEGQTFPVNYSVTVDVTSTDSNFFASGNISVHNPAPISATINDITDIIDPNIATNVTCGVTFPYELAAGQTLTCTYSQDLPNAMTRTNTATATLQNHVFGAFGSVVNAGTTDFSGSASIDFSTATITEVDKCINVSDTFAGFLGTVCAGVDTLPFTFNYTRTIGAFNVCGDTTVDNTATFVAPSGATGNSSWSVLVHVPCQGCTRTIGYWKNHPSEIGKFLPINLGTSGGAKTLKVTTTTQAVNVLNQNVYGTPSNGITKLYAQLLAAKLNIAAGASDSTVANTIAAADAFLATHNYLSWASLTNPQKQMVLGWVTTLDNYNNGIIGPGHCSQ